MKLLQQTLFIARIETRFFLLRPKLLLATLAVVLMPAIYVLIYLSSVWDPAARTEALPVALVNQDKGLEYRNQVFNVGGDVIATLKRAKKFGYTDYTDQEQAREDVRRGKLAFALIIPADFSANAIPGILSGAAKPIVYVSEGNNYDSGIIARQFAETLRRQLNESLNEQRWDMVLSNASGAQHDINNLHAAVQKLSLGAKQLSKGAQETANGSRQLASNGPRLNSGVDQLTSGFKQLGSGLKTLESKLPANTELNRLRNGARSLASGQDAFGKGLNELHAGSQQLLTGINHFKAEADNSMFIPAEVSEGAQKLSDGASQLGNGIDTARHEQVKLADGARQLNNGVRTLTSGMRTMSDNIRQAVARLPADNQLDELDKGASEFTGHTGKLAQATRDVATGTQMLALGIEQLVQALPASLPKPDGSPQGLAHSVAPQVEVAAPVANSGSGFAPNVLAASLWLGAGIAAFLLHVRVLPQEARCYSRLAQIAGKIAFPAGVVILQTLIIGLVMLFLLKIRIVSLLPFALVLISSALTFLLIVFALTRAFGDAGKALAMVLLALQLSSSGGMLPVELSGSLFAIISPWLPLTWVVQALKASMFGAYNHDWPSALAHLAPWTLAALVMACTIGRWRFINQEDHRPAIDL